MSGSATAIHVSRLFRTQRELVARFTSAGALRPESAIPRGTLSRSAASAFARLARAGVLLSRADDRWYLDERAWQRAQSRQQARLLTLAAIITLLAAGLLGLWLALGGG